MLVKELGMLMLDKEVHPLKQLAPMLVADAEITTFVKEMQLRNEFAPMLVIELGIVMLFNEEFPLKALSARDVTE